MDKFILGMDPNISYIGSNLQICWVKPEKLQSSSKVMDCQAEESKKRRNLFNLRKTHMILKDIVFIQHGR